MSFFSKIIISILSNAVAIYAASEIVPGIKFEATLANLLIAGILLGFVNTFVRPLLKLLSLPLLILTLGLFVVIINIAMLMLVSFLMDAFIIESVAAAFWGVIIISLVNYVISSLIND